MFRRLVLSLCAAAALTAAPSAFAQMQTGVSAECLRLKALEIDWGQRESADKHRKLWLETCRKAYAADATNPRIMVALAGAMSERSEFIPILRQAIALDDDEAMLNLFNDYNSFDRHLDRPDLIPRAEAAKALRRAAELGNREAMWRLATILNRGGPIKRDRAGARFWGERALADPPKGIDPGTIRSVVADWLAHSDKPDVRQRGIDILEAMAKAGRGDAQAHLAEAIRRDDPVRARKLLETAVRSYPGHALADLADMLIKGEGGPKDESRALSLLQRSAYDAQHAKWMLGQLMLEGRLVRRDVTQAVKLMGPWSQWDVDTRLEVARVLADNPAVEIGYPEHFLYAVKEAADLGEAGAAEALIGLKLHNAQFADKAGACALAAKVGSEVKECRANQ